MRLFTTLLGAWVVSLGLGAGVALVNVGQSPSYGEQVALAQAAP